MKKGVLAAILALSILTDAQTATIPIVTPTVQDPSAPDPQAKCPGYRASNVFNSTHGFTADLTLAGSPCNLFGHDIPHLALEVSYQSTERLNVKISPKHIAPHSSSWFGIPGDFVQQPQWDGHTIAESSDLQLVWSNNPTLQFAVSRRHSGEPLFSTFGHVIVFEDQFMEIVTNMVDDYNVYGLAENIRNFRLGTNYTQTLFNADTADALDENAYGSHPFYQETRYHRHKPSTAHGVYARNAHAQEWLMREDNLTFRAIGGSIDLYFLSGQRSSESPAQQWSQQCRRKDHHEQNPAPASSALEVFRQYQSGCVGLPTMQPFWSHGFMQCHWGWSAIDDLRNVVQRYEDANIPLEAIWTDIDVYDQYKVFTNDPQRFPSSGMQEFVNYLHSRGQHYVPLVDSNTYFPNPKNASDVYPPFDRGAALSTFVRDPTTGYYYIGTAWPGTSVWADWLVPSSEAWFTNELKLMSESFPYDAIWIDLNEIQSFCSYSCGNSNLTEDMISPPMDLMDPRNLNYPPYKINNAKPSKQIIDGTMALNATHNDEYNTTEYDAHNLWSIGISRAAYNALSQTVHPGKRPFIITRSTLMGSGRYVGHWGGDNDSKWGAMFLSISQALIFQMAGIPMFGTDTCGFGSSVNATEELCARWMELNAFMPFYRNHYGIGKSAQEAYVWPSVANASRAAIAIRYSLLNYLYTLMHAAHTRGDTVLRALAWEFPDDFSLRATDTQFLFGPSLLISPVLTQGATTVGAVFPGIGDSERWYDWYDLQEVKGVKSGENVTLDAPLEKIRVHVRGGSILSLQAPGNTTTATRGNPFALLIALDCQGSAKGSLYLDDGESIEPSETKMIEFSFSHGRLTMEIAGSYHAAAPLANITIAGVESKPKRASLHIKGYEREHGLEFSYRSNTVYITRLEKFTHRGAWENDFALQLW